jgi:hypothetical protein
MKYFLRYDLGFTGALRLVFEIPTVGLSKTFDNQENI